VVAKCLQSKDTVPISPLEAGLGLGLAFGPLGAIFELLKHMGLQSTFGNTALAFEVGSQRRDVRSNRV
jgi:hypothetical protein